jgi:D-glycero-D-manno-heptose 1,7-bisphosphate phosphatase
MLIILDRDGVINEDRVDFVKNLAEFHLIPGSLQAIAALKKAGHLVAVATNQSGIGRGYYSEESLKKIHVHLQNALKSFDTQIDLILYCPHLAEDNCHCRKPKPGMYIEIAKHFSADLTQSFVIGDALRDIEAAIKVGAKPILVKTGKGAEQAREYALLAKIPSYANLAEAVAEILRGTGT